MATSAPPPYTPLVPDGLHRPVFRTTWGRIALGSFGLIVAMIAAASVGLSSVLMNALAFPVLLLAIGSLWFGTLIEALSAPDHVWAHAGQSKVTFVLLIVLLALLGVLLYLLIARPALRDAAAAV